MKLFMKEKELKIMDAALKLFVERGFHGTSTAKIAETAGVATGTLFHYFKTKEELINRLYLYTKENMLSEISEHYDDEKTFKENIKELWLKFVYFGVNEPYKFQFILTFHCSPYITSLTQEQLETYTESMLGIYKVGVEDQKIKKIPFKMAMDYLWGNIVATVNHFERYPENMNEKNLNAAFELLWNGISE